jgi:hypothetical protein
MHSGFGYMKSLLSCAVLSLVMLSAGCAHRYYDPYYHDYHRWDANETVYYNQWVTENHIDPHRDFKRLDKDQQRQYWEWRHKHDHDHDNH